VEHPGLKAKFTFLLGHKEISSAKSGVYYPTRLPDFHQSTSLLHRAEQVDLCRLIDLHGLQVFISRYALETACLRQGDRGNWQDQEIQVTY
jgi:hypothetical protein